MLLKLTHYIYQLGFIKFKSSNCIYLKVHFFCFLYCFHTHHYHYHIHSAAEQATTDFLLAQRSAANEGIATWFTSFRHPKEASVCMKGRSSSAILVYCIHIFIKKYALLIVYSKNMIIITWFLKNAHHVKLD